MNPTATEAKGMAKPRRRRRPWGPRVQGGAPETRRIAAAVLDVLAGGRTPGQAAEALSITVPRYYAVESRALSGLVAACAPRARGRQVKPEKELEALRREAQRLGREVERQKALVRGVQRAVALSAPKPSPKAQRNRRPVVRALRAARVLRSEPEPQEGVAAEAQAKPEL